ncbi:MAG: YicC/YloC family endoribonuclease [Paracoccaceae bacterium]
MTGFANLRGEQDNFSWSWELRAVNARGFDLRLRAPEWIEGLEPALRSAISKAVTRGNVTLNLRLTRDEISEAPVVNPAALEAALNALSQIEAAAHDAGMPLAPSTAPQIMALRGVMEAPRIEADAAPLLAALLAQIPALIESFEAMRIGEGAALRDLLTGQIDEIARLTQAAAKAATARKAQVAANLKAALARILESAEADPDRIAQELALLAVKSDITEEIDRLHTHVATARALLKEGGPVGRKLDFLTQEFNREANTLCSKAGAADLTSIGLDLKAVIDQMREQVQNVE